MVTKPENGKVLQLKISLMEIHPEIWRRIIISDNANFNDLHGAIQGAMGWESYHKYEFQIGKETITCGEEGFNAAEGALRPLIKSGKFAELVEKQGLHKGAGMMDLDKLNSLLRQEEMNRAQPKYDMNTPLGTLVSMEGQEFTYIYDFGDNWEHKITVEKIMEEKPEQILACLAGERACPPEDCGGTSGYENFLKAISDKSHKEHKEMLEWAGESFDPEEFDLENANWMMQPENAALSVAGELLDELEESGYNVRQKLVQEILKNPAAIPLLVDVLEDEEGWNDEGPLLIHAIHLLAMIKAQEAVKPILHILRKDPDCLGDFLTEDIPSILFSFGENHVDEFIEFMMDKKNDHYARSAATSAVAMFAHENKALMPKVATVFMKILEDALKGREDPEFVSFIAEDAAGLQDENLFSLVKQAFEKKVILKDFIDVDLLEEAHRERRVYLVHPQHRKNPADYFDKENLAYLGSINTSNGNDNENRRYNLPENSIRGLAQYNSKKKPQKIGVNEKCPCDSGKKYKKCCMGKGIYERQ